MHWIAVITGDIVDSTHLSGQGRKRLEEILTDGLTALVGKQKFDIYRGDSFQVVLENPEEALKTAIQIRCLLRKSLVADPGNMKSLETTAQKQTLSSSVKKHILDARISIGIGNKGYAGTKIRTSDGEAFQLSGRALDLIKSKGPRLAVSTPREELNEYMAVICSLLDVFLHNWSRQQAEVIFEQILGKKQTEIAEMLQISQASVSQRMAAAHWQEVEKAIVLFENKIKEASK